jgi:DNA-binding XRE family transcriptional regulator
MFTRPQLLLPEADAGGLPAFLRYYRKRMPASATALGSYRRLPSRFGKPVTQEEVAEALGVTRTWYALLETSHAPRPSLRLLSRIAKVLMLGRRERAQLFALAFANVDDSA